VSYDWRESTDHARVALIIGIAGVATKSPIAA
jgi:hypothetical protein